MNSKNVVTKSKNVTYYVNREKKTVVAVIECDPSIPILIFDKVFGEFGIANGNRNLLDVRFDYFFGKKRVSIDKRYVGIAKCHDGDTFDEEFGKKLALARAKAKKARAVYDHFFKFIEQLGKLNYMTGEKSDELYGRWIESEGEVGRLLNSVIKR